MRSVRMCDLPQLILRLSTFENLSRRPSVSSLHTVFRTQLEPLANPQSAHPQRAGPHSQELRKTLAVPDLVALVAVIIVQNEVASFRRKLAETPPQAFQTALRIAFRFPRHDARLRRLVQGTHLPEAVPSHFPKNHARDADAVGADIANLLTFADLSGATVNGFIGVFVRCGASPPLEDTDEVAADLQIAAAGCIAIGTEAVEQLVESFLCELYRHSPSSVNAAQ